MNESVERSSITAAFVRLTGEEPVLKAAASREIPRRISVEKIEGFDQVRAGNLVPAVAAYIKLFGLGPRGWSSEWKDEGDHVLIKQWAKGKPTKFLRAGYTITGGDYVFDEPKETTAATKPAPRLLDSAFSTIDVNPTDLAKVVKDLYGRVMARAADTLRRKTGAPFSVADVKRSTPQPGAFSIWPRGRKEDDGS